MYIRMANTGSVTANAKATETSSLIASIKAARVVSLYPRIAPMNAIYFFRKKTDITKIHSLS